MAVLVRSDNAENTFGNGTIFDVDEYGNLEVLDEDFARIGLFRNGYWQYVAVTSDE